jgi:hypothetical protein
VKLSSVLRLMNPFGGVASAPKPFPGGLVTGGMGLGWLVVGGMGWHPVTVGPTVYASLEAAVRARLLASPLLTGLVEVHLRTVPRRSAYPYMVQTPIQSVGTLNTSLVSYWAEETIQYDVVATDDGTAERLRRAAAAVIGPGAERFRFADGREMTRNLTGNWAFGGSQGQGRGGVTLYRYAFQITFLVARHYNRV